MTVFRKKRKPSTKQPSLPELKLNSHFYGCMTPLIAASLSYTNLKSQLAWRADRFLNNKFHNQVSTCTTGYNNGNEWERSHTPALPPSQPAEYPQHTVLPGSHDNDDDNNHEPVNMEGVDCTGAVAQSS